MGIVILILLIISPIIWLILQCKPWVRVTAAASTWCFLFWFIGEACRQQTGEPWHGLFIGLSVPFFIYAWITKKAYRAGYGNFDKSYDDNPITDPKDFWIPSNIWHDDDK